MFDRSFSHITADAATPEQTVPYVLGVSGRKALGCGPFVAYVQDGHAVLAAYPGLGGFAAWGPRAEALALLAEGQEASSAPDCYGTPEALRLLADNSPDPDFVREVETAIAELPETIVRVTVMAPYRPACAPPAAASLVDCYWSVPIPHPAAGQKLRNMLTRAARDVQVREESFAEEHQALVGRYLTGRPLGPGTRSIFSSLGAYLAAPGAKGLLLAARDAGGRLTAFSIGEYSSLHTAMYMFSFRAGDAPPGTADLLLQGLLEHAAQCGHSRMNLGLGISGGIRGFKKKWQAKPALPYVETSWERSTQQSGFWTGMLKKITRKKA